MFGVSFPEPVGSRFGKTSEAILARIQVFGSLGDLGFERLGPNDQTLGERSHDRVNGDPDDTCRDQGEQDNLRDIVPDMDKMLSVFRCLENPPSVDPHRRKSDFQIAVTYKS